MRRVKIKHVVRDWDMRKIHNLRYHALAHNLKTGEVLVAFNRAETIFRMVDAMGGVYGGWADQGCVFDLDEVARFIREGLLVEIVQSSRGTGEPERQRSAA